MQRIIFLYEEDVGNHPWQNVLDYGAVGNTHYADGGGADDTGAIQAAIDVAAANGGHAEVRIPGGRSYRLTDTLDVPPGIFMRATGGMALNGVWSPPMLVWDGADNGIMVQVNTTGTNTPGTLFENLNFYTVGGGITNHALTGVKFTGSGGGVARVDDRTGFRGCSFQGFNGDAIELTDGATNFFIEGGRFDSNLGYALKVGLNGSSRSFVGHIYGNVNYVGGTRGQGNGFIFLDGETADLGTSMLTITALHTEINQELDETFASGTKPFDRRGIIRLGVNPSLGVMQHHLQISGWHNSFGSFASFSCIQITSQSGTETTASECVSVDINRAHGLNAVAVDDDGTDDEVRVFGGMVPLARRYPFASFEHGNLSIGWGKDASAAGFRSYIGQRHGSFPIRGLSLLPETVSQLDSYPATGGLAWVTDATSTTLGTTVAGGGSNDVIVFHNGTAWKIISVVN